MTQIIVPSPSPKGNLRFFVLRQPDALVMTVEWPPRRSICAKKGADLTAFGAPPKSAQLHPAQIAPYFGG
jgi:hypothetical protein